MFFRNSIQKILFVLGIDIISILMYSSHATVNAGTVTCDFTANDNVDQVWVDGADKTTSVVPQSALTNIWVKKTLTFDDTASVLAIKARDNQIGTVQPPHGGFAIICTSTKTDSLWNMDSEADRTRWVVSSGVGSYPTPATDRNGLEWYDVGYIYDPLVFGEPLVAADPYVLGAVDKVAIRGRVENHNKWNLLFDTGLRAGGGGDPHFHAFGNIFFSWQGSCDLVLLKTSKLSVHIRTRKIRKWSAIDSIAIKIGNDVLEIGSRDGKLSLNGKNVESINCDSFSVTKSVSQSQKRVPVYDVDFRKSKKLEVKVNTRSQMIYATFSGKYPKDTVGLLGSPRNPGLFSRNGTNMTITETNAFAETWQVNDSEPQLFQETRAPQFPAKCQYHKSAVESSVHGRHLKEVLMISRDEAATSCAMHHPGPMRDFCIEDVQLTGDIKSAVDSIYG